MHDDELSKRMAVLAADAERAATVAPAARIRARGERRRLRFAGAVGLVAGLATLVGYPIATAMAPDGPTPIVTTWPDPTTIPSNLRMPHEGEAGWQRSDDRSIASAFMPCRIIDPAAPDITLPGRTDARTMTGRGQAAYTEHLFVYGTEPAAAAAMTALVRDAARCGWNPGVQLGDGSDAERLYSARSLREPADPAAEFGYATALRRGNVLFVVYGVVENSITDGTDGAATEAIGDLLCQTRQLCPAHPAAEATWLPVSPPGN